MARHLFGLSPADLAMERVGDELRLRPGAVGTVWDAYSGGLQYTDLLDRNGTTPIFVVTADSDAGIAFYGPNDVALLYVDFGYGRYAMTAIDLGELIDGKVDVAGDTMTGLLTVPTINVTGLADLDGPLTVAGASSFADDLLVAGELEVDGAVLAAEVDGDTGAGGTLTLRSTTNATKGKVLIGTSAYDEVNQRLGLGTASPATTLHVASGVTAGTAPVRLTTSSTAGGNRALASRQVADVNDRYAVDFSGTTQWGDGTSLDTNLYRGGADLLSTDDSLQVGVRLGVGQVPDGSIRVVAGQSTDVPVVALANTTGGGTVQPLIRLDAVTAASVVLGSRASGDSDYRYAQKMDGRLEWGSGAAARDTNLYRSAANVLKTDDALQVVGALTVTALATFNGGIDVNGVGESQFYRKTADQGVTNSTTLVNDSHLVSATLPASSTWLVELVFAFSTPAAADIKTAFAIPSGATSRMIISGPDGNIGYVIDGTTADQWPVTDTAIHAGHYHGVLVVGASSGVFRFQFAQLVADSGTTTMRTNSYMRLTRVA